MVSPLDQFLKNIEGSMFELMQDELVTWAQKTCSYTVLTINPKSELKDAQALMRKILGITPIGTSYIDLVKNVIKVCGEELCSSQSEDTDTNSKSNTSEEPT